MDNETMSLEIFYYGLYTLKGFFTYRLLINSGESLEQSIWILMGGTLWILPVSVCDLALKEGGSWFIRDKQLVFPESAYIVSDTEQVKDVKRSFYLPGAGYFDGYC